MMATAAIPYTEIVLTAVIGGLVTLTVTGLMSLIKKIKKTASKEDVDKALSDSKDYTDRMIKAQRDEFVAEIKGIHGKLDILIEFVKQD